MKQWITIFHRTSPITETVMLVGDGPLAIVGLAVLLVMMPQRVNTRNPIHTAFNNPLGKDSGDPVYTAI
jgi:hypothetical protein